MTSSIGWIYCFENPSMPEIFKIGVTTRTPADRLLEANQSDTWRPPTPYSIVMTKRVRDVFQKETQVHDILNELGFRIHPRREFFNAPLTLVKQLFDLMDECSDEVTVTNVEVDNEEEEEEITNTMTVQAAVNKQYCESIRACLDDFRRENPTVQTIMSSELYKYYAAWCEGRDNVLKASLRSFGGLISSDIGIIRQHTSAGNKLFIGGYQFNTTA
jgi:hypothetical protein